jgi:hypothetical protein
MSRGVSQSSAFNRSYRMLGKVDIFRCFVCEYYLIGICQRTGNRAADPICGPIPDDCPLPKKPEEE